MASSARAVKVIGMQSSSSEESYAQHSTIQNRNFHSVAKPVLAKAIEQLLGGTRAGEFTQGQKHIAIADLGCSYGRNTLDCAEFILAALQQNWASKTAEKMPEIQYFFSDLPSNDFNALFQSLHPYLHHPPDCDRVAAGAHDDLGLPKMYAAGVPGSFYGRLFPCASLDLVICSYSLHWLSQVPPSIRDMASPIENDGNTWISKASKSVKDAYALQSQIDVRNFLKSRSEELSSGGILFLLLVGSTSILDDEDASEFRGPMEIFNCAWKELVNKGIITIEEMETFNMPMYFFNQHELENVLQDFKEFKVLHMDTVGKDNEQGMYTLDQCIIHITSMSKPIVDTHLGEKRSKEFYKKFKMIGSEENKPKANLYHNVVAALLQRL